MNPKADLWKVMINETAAKNLGFKSPEEAVNEPLDIGRIRSDRHRCIQRFQVVVSTPGAAECRLRAFHYWRSGMGSFSNK